ncbi:YjgB family protein [Heyndrickxia acidicola]|uniref:YjgB family protein n=1 Tax=Heyndrickxia acidicola TaxID=209389 RepID=A0ABU6MFZ8_9BACI|nr:YjgB family protein [Heyndrickxia acidicola]MED1203618.1 YjgB family protein [Heyndrickxia acidicola]
MLNKKSKILVATTLTGSIIGIGAAYTPSLEPAHAAHVKMVHVNTYQQDAVKKLKMIYHEAFKGQMPFAAEGLKINKSTKKDVHKKLGPPETVSGGFDYYHADMGQPGFAFSYNKNKTISQIRYFGTNVERKDNLGSITPKVLGKVLGKADHIRRVKGTSQINYIYKTGKYELEFIVGKDHTVDHVNLKMS